MTSALGTRDVLARVDMSWLRDIFGGRRKQPHAALRSVQERFVNFIALLEKNNQILKRIADVEEKLQDDPQLDVDAVRTALGQIRSDVCEAVENMIVLGGDRYAPLKDRYAAIDGEMTRSLLPGGPIEEEEPIVPLDSSATTGASQPEPSPQVAALKQFLSRITPLILMDPSDADFSPESCQTFRDIARFTHQKAMEEMFTAGHDMSDEGRIGVRLKSDIPLPVNLVYIDQDLSEYQGKPWISEAQIASMPMRAFWGGLLREGWPSQAPTTSVRGFMSVLATTMSTPQSTSFAESSFALLSKEYMIINLHMGYHVAIVEAMCSPAPSMNYVRMQFKRGGASLDRRIRRVHLIADILGRARFESLTNKDFLDTMITHQDAESVAEKLHMLGRLTIMTKQLDMALTNDGVAQWYTDDFVRRLGLDQPSQGPPRD